MSSSHLDWESNAEIGVVKYLLLLSFLTEVEFYNLRHIFGGRDSAISYLSVQHEGQFLLHISFFYSH